MGALVAEQMVPSIQTELNLRFAPGDPIAEMGALHREFGLYSGSHDLASLASLLNIGPPDPDEQAGWIQFLNYLSEIGSDVQGVNAHDRIIMAIRENLESEEPHPVFFTWHPASQSGRLMVTLDPAFSFSSTEYLTISVPTLDADRPPLMKAK